MGKQVELTYVREREREREREAVLKHRPWSAYTLAVGVVVWCSTTGESLPPLASSVCLSWKQSAMCSAILLYGTLLGEVDPAMSVFTL